MCVLGRAAGILMCLWPDTYNKEAFPLFEYCPVYHATVGPGDVLFNPPWWWHAIKNVTPTSVGVATRWHTDGICGTLASPSGDRAVLVGSLCSLADATRFPPSADFF
jgi:hypothetical protein